MTDNKPMMMYTATYESVSAAMTDLDAIEQLHKDDVIGKYDAAGSRPCSRSSAKPDSPARMFSATGRAAQQHRAFGLDSPGNEPDRIPAGTVHPVQVIDE